MDHKHTASNINAQDKDTQLEDTPKGEPTEEEKTKTAQELFRQTKPRTRGTTIWAGKVLDMVNIDLMDMSKVATKNKNYNFALIWIDIHSRYAYAIPIKNKFSTTVLDALKKLPKPKAYISDNGGEFKGAVGEWMRNNGIEQFMVEVGDHNSLGIVDRFVRTLRERLHVLWAFNRNFDWISYIEDVVYYYNKKEHSTLKASPIDVFKGNDISQQDKYVDKYLFGFKEGDRVRKLNKKHILEKGGKTWSKQIYTVKARKGYRIVLTNDDIVPPRHLLKTDATDETEETDINKELKELTKEKQTKHLLKREEIDPANIRTSSRQRKKKEILDL